MYIEVYIEVLQDKEVKKNSEELHDILGNIFSSLIIICTPDIYSGRGSVLHSGFQITKSKTFGPMVC